MNKNNRKKHKKIKKQIRNINLSRDAKLIPGFLPGK